MMLLRIQTGKVHRHEPRMLGLQQTNRKACADLIFRDRFFHPSGIASENRRQFLL